MQSPGNLPLEGDRYTPFVRTLQFIGYNFTGGTFAAQVRDREDGGQLRADLGTVTGTSAQGLRLIYGGTDTVANHISAGRLTEAPEGYTTSSSLTLSLIGMRINETTMEAMPFAPEIGSDVTLYWDMHITPSGGDKDLWLFGTFTVRAGATQ